MLRHVILLFLHQHYFLGGNIRLQNAIGNRQFFDLTNNMPNFGAEKSASFPPEASQQGPGGVLVPVFHTRPYYAVPECVTLASGGLVAKSLT